MCGIILLLQKSEESSISNLFEECQELIKARGPDSYNIIQTTHEHYKLKFGSSVLWLQGTNVTEQPVETTNSIFIYNGDIFGRILDSSKISKGDTLDLLEAIEESDNLQETLSKVEGPYAFVYFDKVNSKLIFGRDIYGRRSLLIGTNGTDILITSVSVKNSFTFIELPSIGTFTLNLLTNKITLIPWKSKNKNFNDKLNDVQNCLNINVDIDEHFECNDRLCNFREPTDLDFLNKTLSLPTENAFRTLLANPNWTKEVDTLENKLFLAVQKRLLAVPNYCKNCIQNRISCNHCKIGVLFSGGLDCTVLALFLDKYLEINYPIDLLNVAFDRGNGYNTPDRLTGLESFNELVSLRPERVWNFCEINVTEDELNNLRMSRIRHLIFPLNTILDDSLGCAFWFASRGKAEGYVSPCRVLLVGSGADELFGGYTHHRAALKHKGWKGLFMSLTDDWQNIPHRNLARDDRVVSDHGRQLRLPYLDEDLVNYVHGLNAWQKTFPADGIEQGLGDKILLRSLAFRLGLRKAAGFKKRAIQFGSKIANKKENARDISPRL